MTQFSEPDQFVLYWLQFFGRPMTTEGLSLLWARRKGSVRAAGPTRLSIPSLATTGVVRYGKADFVMLVGELLSPDDWKAVWSASEKGDWTVSKEFLCGRWAERAFKLRHGEWSYRSEVLVDEAVQRHIIYRWGITAAIAYWEAYSSISYSQENVDEFGDDAVLWRKVKALLKKFEPGQIIDHSGFDSFADIVTSPPGMDSALLQAYLDSYREPIERKFRSGVMLKIARFEARALRGGRAPFVPETEAEFVARLAVDDFFEGSSVGWAVERLNEIRKTSVLSPNATLCLQALAFWRGDFATVEAVDRESPYCVGHKRSVAGALKLARDGGFAEAEKVLTSAIGLQYYPVSEQWHYIDYPILLILLICKVRAGGGGNIQSLKRTMRVIDGIVEWESVADIRHFKEDEKWVSNFVSVIPKADAFENPLKCSERMPFLHLQALSISLGLSKSRLDRAAALDMARRARANGYPSIAADIVSVVRRADANLLEGSVPAEAFEQIGADEASVFAAPREMSHFWERALDVLESALPPAPSAKSARAPRAVKEPDLLCWGLELIDRGGWKFVGYAYPLLRKRDKFGGLEDPIPVSAKSFIAGRFDSLLTPADAKIKMALVSTGCVTADSYGDPATPSVETLRLFSGLDNLYSSNSNYRYRYWTPSRDMIAKPLSLTVEPARLALGYRPDGSVEIGIPVLLKDFSDRDRYAIDRKKSNNGEAWTIREVTPAYLKIVKALGQISPESKIVIPAEGAPRVEKFCSSVPAEAPIAWAQSSAAKEGDVPRAAALSAPLVRLAFANDALTASVAVRLSDEPSWTSEPAKGPPERLVVRKDSTRVFLTRDFAAEETSVAAARQTLARFESAKTDESHWYFTGIEESLDALAVLHAASADGAFALEWPEGESLKLSELVSHATRVEGGETADYWLGMSGEFKLDDGRVLSFVELLKSFDAREGAYVRLTEGRYLKLSAALARRLEALKGAGIAQGGKLMLSPAAIPALEKIARETEADDVLPLPEVVKRRIETIREAFAARLSPPKDLKCQMRPYQAEGYRWLARLERCGIGACLADDMGLGKTVQLIALMLAQKAKGPSLVIAPASVAFNWRDEIARFAPTLKVALVGQTPGADEDVAKEAKTHDVVITSYGVLSSREEKFADLDWNILVLDEAQAIKNHQTKRAQSVKRLKARFRAVATGTPIENRLTELWSIFDFLNPGMLGGETRFNRELAPHGEASPRLKRLVKPLILRRLKRDVLTDLPEKEEITVNVVLGDEERHAYEATRLNALAKLEGGDKENKIAILAELTRLRRFCCHPSLVMPSVLASAKLDALERLLEDLRESNHRALVFSQFVDYLAIVRKLLERRGWTYKYLDGATPKSEREKGVAAFQGGEGDFYLISLKAGGMGLNLTAANYVILLDPWWNPAVENQAADRVHRIGQHLPVTVYRLIAQDTIEEKVVRLHAKKTALADDVLAEGASALSAAAMLELLSDS